MTRRRYAIATIIAASVSAASFVAVAIADPFPRVIWNASASAPIGLYRIRPERDPPTGVLVAITPPEHLSRWLSARGYLPEGVPLLKHVTAKAGQRVCRVGAVVSVDARPVATALAHDGRGRPLPVWQGCRTLQTGELLLLNPAHPDSLDGRYFGPLPASAVIGRATPLWLRAPSPPLLSPPDPKELAMKTNILEPTANGYAGDIRLFGIKETIALVAVEANDIENAPDYRVHLDNEDGPDIGGAWKRVGERAGDYIALEVDSPLFPSPFRPVLFRADDEGRTFRFSWKRPRSRDDRN